MSTTLFVQQLINGVSLGASMPDCHRIYDGYGILRLINFAHGDLLMVSAYAAIYGIVLFSLPGFLVFHWQSLQPEQSGSCWIVRPTNL